MGIGYNSLSSARPARPGRNFRKGPDSCQIVTENYLGAIAAFGAFVARRGGRAAPDGPLKDHDSETDDARLARHFLEQSRAVFDL